MYKVKLGECLKADEGPVRTTTDTNGKGDSSADVAYFLKLFTEIFDEDKDGEEKVAEAASAPGAPTKKPKPKNILRDSLLFNFTPKRDTQLTQKKLDFAPTADDSKPPAKKLKR